MFTKQYDQTILSNFLEHELEGMSETYTVGSTTSSTYYVEKMTSNGDILAPISSSKQSIQNLITDSTIRFGIPNDSEPDRHSTGDFISHMQGSVIIIEQKLTFAESIPIIAKFVSKAGSNFYGAILRNGSSFINPLHPLAALGGLEYHLHASTKYTLHIYCYKNRASIDKLYGTENANIESMKANLQNIIKAYSSEPVATAICTEKKINLTGYTLNVSFRNKVKFTDYWQLSNSGAGYEYYLSAQQILTRGIFFPYYGTSLIRKTKEGRGEGMTLSPFLAVNIGSPSNPELAGMEPSKFTGICTGSQPSHTLEGIRSLTHANMSSPMNRNTLLSGFLAYADICINLSLEFYGKAGIIEDYTPIPTDYSTKVDIPEEYILLYLQNQLEFTSAVSSSLPFETAIQYYRQLKDLYAQGALDDYKETTDKGQVEGSDGTAEDQEIAF